MTLKQRIHNHFFDDEYGVPRFLPLVTVGILGILGTGLPIAYFGGRAECSAKADEMNVEHTYGFWAGCMVDGGNGMIPLDQVRGSEDFGR